MDDAQSHDLGRRGIALVAFAAAVTMMARLWEGDLRGGRAESPCAVRNAHL